MGAARFFELTEDIRLDLLELYGSGYVIEHCVSAQLRYIEDTKRHTIEQSYISDCLRLITENTAKASMQGDAAYYSRRLAEIMDPRSEEPGEVDGDAIAREVIRKAGLTAKGVS